MLHSGGVGTPSQRYSSRKNAKQVVCSFGEESDQPLTTTETLQPTITISSGEDGLTLETPYGFMFEKLRMSSMTLDDIIGDLADQIKVSQNIDEWAHVRVPSNVDMWFIGRICCDSVGRLNSASVLLEGCQENSDGATVKLDLSQLQQYSIFPGQVVAVKGINPTGNCLTVSSMISGNELPKRIPEADRPEAAEVLMNVASGPFTTKDNLLFEPLTDFLNAIKKNPPHVLVLIGPLLDASHSLLMKPDLDETYDTIVEQCIKTISTILENTNIQVYIVASSNDTSCEMIYPTPPAQVTTDCNRIKMVSDPVVLNLNGTLRIGITSTDIMLHLSKEEIASPPQSGDRLSRIARHLILQQSFYPLYPPSESLNVILPYYAKYGRLDYTPDILILPSDLRHFIKDIGGCVTINPERLAKGLVGGCYASIKIDQRNKNKPILAQILKI